MITPRRSLAAVWAMAATGALLVGVAAAWAVAAEGAGDIDFQRARELMQKQRAGQTLTKDEQEFLTRAQAAYRQRQGRMATQPAGGGDRPAMTPKPTTGLAPLCDMGAGDKYKGEDGGLYGGGRNDPPAAHAEAARKELAAVVPRDADGKPAPDGKVVLMSIGMSNTTQEFSTFVRLAEKDASRSKSLVIVDAAAGGQDVTAWAESRTIRSNPNAMGAATIWELADKRLQAAGVTPRQVQVVWLKQAMIGPVRYGEFPAHARKLADGETTILNLARQRYPNLRVAYLSSRIYAGYAVTPLNPEPYSYESAFACRWLIQQQIAGDAKLNWDPAKGAVKSPLLLWGPYLWGDGTTPRKSDGLVWLREDLANDGTHPSGSGGMPKVARMLLKFFQTDPLARTWYLAPEAMKDAGQ